MTKADIVSQISEQTGMEKGDIQVTVEAFMRAVRNNLENGNNVYLRGFGSFVREGRVLPRPAATSSRRSPSKSPPTTSLHSSQAAISWTT